MINWRSNYAFALYRDTESRWSEARLILGSFLIILLVGTLFLVQPSSHNGEVTFINALFTATSAISVTGLGVVDTGTAFTLQGQIILLMLMAMECVSIAGKAKDTAGTIIAASMGGLIAFQSFVNIGVATFILPNTGLPLPFVSYGLTSLMSLYIGMGVVLNVRLQAKRS